MCYEKLLLWVKRQIVRSDLSILLKMGTKDLMVCSSCSSNWKYVQFFCIKLNWIECNHLQPNWIKFEWNKVIDVWSPMLEIKSGGTFHMKLWKVNWTLWSQFYHETGLNKAQMNREINQESMISREMNVRTKEKEFKFSIKKSNL